jgi:two-component system, OmpR family, sensor histidine kinase KdpD
LNINWSSRWWGYLIGFGMVAVVTLAGYFLHALPSYSPYNTAMLYIFCVAVSAAYLGFWPSILASILSTLAFDFFFTAPVLTFNMSNDQDIISVPILAIITIAISCLSPKIRQ